MNKNNYIVMEESFFRNSEEYLFRKLLWLRHGCPISSLYGDDGEMQCSSCLIDFKRDSAQMIAQKFREMSLQRIKEYFQEMKNGG